MLKKGCCVKMINILFPNIYIRKVFDIDFYKVYKLGYRGLIFDIDSTLVPHGSDSTKEVDELFEKLQRIGFKTIFLSNNSASRIERFNKNINIAFIDEANKPNKNGYIKAIERLEVEKSEILLIGDQIFTDILGANLTKIDSVLVKYLLHENEVKIGKKRRVEKAVLWIFFLTKWIFKKNSKIEKLKVNYNEKA